jgi:hypothetical protein
MASGREAFEQWNRLRMAIVLLQPLDERLLIRFVEHAVTMRDEHHFNRPRPAAKSPAQIFGDHTNAAARRLSLRIGLLCYSGKVILFCRPEILRVVRIRAVIQRLAIGVANE